MARSEKPRARGRIRALHEDLGQADSETRTERAQVVAILRELDDARERASLTKAALAIRAEIPEASVRKLFTSRTANPSFTTLNRLARALGLRVSLTKLD